MPIHEYRCPICENEEERLVRSDDRDNQTCGHEAEASKCEAKLERVEVSSGSFKINRRFY